MLSAIYPDITFESGLVPEVGFFAAVSGLFFT
jgi:hypothetical protein